MQKSIIIILAIIAVIIAAMVFFMFNPLAIFQFLTGSSCASIGVTHLSERDLGRIEDNPEYQDMIILTDEDLKKAPKIQEVVRKSSSKIQFNDDYREYISYDKMEQYYQFLEEQYRQQVGFTPRQKQYGFLIEYDGKSYLVGDFVSVERGQNVEIYVSRDPMINAPKITLSEDDLDKIPIIKRAISGIGTYRVSTHESVGVSESDLDKYGKWLFKQYESQYGNATGKPYSYFKYRDQTYFVTFSIC
ncbi:hypothetical protein [Candidatus Nitrosotenuis uzonensis]|uniref:Uncharacterized protein n=1 Tax=Candidatus Nitrosotenuis uzonensis TaxID=1407055 RepID=A0A812F1A2_9ARCH|nr:hypothetical protein [Candidatus Nitrosotenuis uzonensis]CAE6493322.1 hypothetical protein NUZ5A_50148 [Candidatus Nitrosotenuis uzonensis]